MRRAAPSRSSSARRSWRCSACGPPTRMTPAPRARGPAHAQPALRAEGAPLRPPTASRRDPDRRQHGRGDRHVSRARGAPMVTGDVVNAAARLQTAGRARPSSGERTTRAARASLEGVGPDARGNSAGAREAREGRAAPGAPERGVPGLIAPMVGRGAEVDVGRSVFRAGRARRAAARHDLRGRRHREEPAGAGVPASRRTEGSRRTACCGVAACLRGRLTCGRSADPEGARRHPRDRRDRERGAREDRRARARRRPARPRRAAGGRTVGSARSA